MVGTSGRQRVDTSRLIQYLVVVPDKSVANAFGDIISYLHIKISANDEEAKNLSSIRDTLLPRLISGKLRLPEAEAIMDEIS